MCGVGLCGGVREKRPAVPDLLSSEAVLYVQALLSGEAPDWKLPLP